MLNFIVQKQEAEYAQLKDFQFVRNHYIYLLQQLKKIEDITVEEERATFLGMQCHPLQLMVMNCCEIHGNNAAVLSVCVSEDYWICFCVLRCA